MFADPASLVAITSELLSRDVSLWHACQLTDLRSYARVGGIPSRQLLERSRHGFTAFVTDTIDRTNGVWDKVFLNMSDFGSTFATGGQAVPNPYGPIAIQVNPEALLAADDVAICLRSAGAVGFDRRGEALGTFDEVRRLFRYPSTAGPQRSFIVRSSDDLRDAFPERVGVKSPEISCTFRSGVAIFAHAVVVWVDPISIHGTPLIRLVEESLRAARHGVRVHQRMLSDERRQVMAEVTHVLAQGYVPLRLLAGRVDVTDATRNWAALILERGLDWQYDRYARYLIDGTLSVASTPSELADPIPSGFARPSAITHIT